MSIHNIIYLTKKQERRDLSMVVQYKCPSCVADMAFDSNSGTLHCESCGRKESIEQYKSSEKDDSFFKDDHEETSSSPHLFQENEAKEYHCKNCGAVLMTDNDTTATSCSFCGAGIVLGDRLSGKLAPTKVIPFTISKEEAIGAFKKWCRKGLLTPKGFMTADRIKSITGMYVPFFLYDVNGKGELTATCTRVRTYSHGDYIYTETKYYHVFRRADLYYNNIPVDASEKMDDTLMDKLEPFSYQNLKEFKMPYLAGFISERYNYDENQLFPRVKERAEQYVNNYLRSSIAGYTTTAITNEEIRINKRHSDYTLLPVWMVCYDYKQAEHTFAMNGQTGKIVGKPPISKEKVIAWFAGVSGVSLIIIKLIAFMLGGGFF